MRLTADQAGNDQYNAAPMVTANIEVNNPAKLDQTITNFSPATSAEVKSQATLTATGGASGKPVTYASTTPAVCTVSDNQTITLVTTGTCTVTANQEGNDQYNVAPTVTANIQVNAPVVKKDQVITNFSPTGYAFTVDKAMVNGQTTLTATGGASGNPVTYTSTTPAVCTVSGNTVSLIAVGTCTIKANQDGNDLYNPASSETTAIQVNQPVETSSPTTSNWSLVTTSTVGNSLTLTATGDTSANPVTFTSTTPTVCTVSGNTVRLDAVGTCTVTANQAGNTTSTVVATITVTPVPATTVPATTVSSTPVISETPSTPPPSQACPNITVDNGVLIVSGTCDAKGEVFDQPLKIEPGASLSNATFNNTVDNQGFLSNLKIGEQGSITGGTLSGSVNNQGKVCDIQFVGSSFVGGTVCGKIENKSKVGACLILENVTVLPNTTFKGCVTKKDQAIMVEDTESVTTGNTSSTTLPTPVKKEQTITFDEISSPTTAKVGSQQLLQVTASSGLVVNLVSDTPQVCKLFGSAVTFLTTGTCTVTANQAGNDDYNAAKPVSASINVVTEVPVSVFRSNSLKLRRYMNGTFNMAMMRLKMMGLKFFSDGVSLFHGVSLFRSKPTPMTGNNLAFLNALGDSLQAAGYNRNDLVVGTDGNLFVAGDNHGLLASVNGTEAYTGTQTPGLYSPETEFPYLVFMDTDGQLKQTVFYPLLSPTISTAMTRDFPTVTMDTAFDGTIKLTLEGGVFSFWQAGYVITAGDETSDMKIVRDNLVLSGDGQTQELTPAAPVFDDSSIAFLTISQTGVSELGLDPNHLMMTGLGTFVITDANDQTILSFQAATPELDTGTQAAGLYVSEGETPYVLFVDVDNQLKRSLIHPALSPDILVAALEAFPQSEFTLSPDGKVTVSFAGEPATEWQPAYLVTTGGETFEKQLVEGQLILSGGGQSQVLLPVQP